MAVADEVEALVTRSPGLTEAEIAAALFGDAGSQQRINKACMDLVKSRRIERGGANHFGVHPTLGLVEQSSITANDTGQVAQAVALQKQGQKSYSQ